MMTISLFVAVVVVAVVTLADVNGGPPPPPPPRCCMPNQYSAYMYPLESFNTGEMLMFDMQMDYDKKQQVIMNYTIGPVGSIKLNQKVLIDYNKNMLYAVPAADPDQCFKSPYTMPLAQCIPNDAEYLGSTYMGPMSGGLPYDGWRFKLTKNSTSMIATLAVSKNSCVPLVEGVGFPNNKDWNQMYMLSSYQPRLWAPSAFKLPKSCFN
ncbi:uncharacterized protein LOC143293123 [Babylonia areolata]|uniref:uncharacterized protein LOC143293123 n=1 Tax=Babylonia areolata TaxID=304850 RepID=UPI003FD0FA47